MFKFIVKNYKSEEQVLFWPDFMTCHYKKENFDFLRDNGIALVEKAEILPMHLRLHQMGYKAFRKFEMN